MNLFIFFEKTNETRATVLCAEDYLEAREIITERESA